METIIIDENYDGVYKVGEYFVFDEDIWFPESNIEINIPLVCKKSIVGKSIKINRWLFTYGSIKAGGSIESGGLIEAGSH